MDNADNAEKKVVDNAEKKRQPRKGVRESKTKLPEDDDSEKKDDSKTGPSKSGKYEFEEFDSQEEVLTLILNSWDLVNSKERLNGGKAQASMEPASGLTVQPVVQVQEPQKAEKKRGFFGGGKKQSKSSSAAGGYTAPQEGAEEASKAAHAPQNDIKQFHVPETFDEMVRLNAAMTSANLQYIGIMLDHFDGLVRDTCQLGQLQEQTDILAMRICKECKAGQYKLSEFKICVLASMRSLIPATWDTKHEKAWVWLADSIEAMIKDSLPLPPKYERPVRRFLNEDMNNKEMRDMGLRAWYRLFKKNDQVEILFKQSNERLKFIAEQALLYCQKIYKDPAGVNTEIQELGTKHIMWRVKPTYFQAFVQCLDEEIRELTDDVNVINGINWSLTVVATIMARTVENGSTPLLMAALSNDVKGLKAVLAEIPRGVRGRAMLYA